MVSNDSSTSIKRAKNSLIKYEGHKKTVRGLSLLFLGKTALRKRRKKTARKKYRFFVDNIIMHHHRLHQKNRDIVLDKINLLGKEKKKKKDIELNLRMSHNLSLAKAKSSAKIKNYIMNEVKKKQISISGTELISKEKSKFSVKSL
jgi:GTPase involved in cell partitioning and DNA repair